MNVPLECPNAEYREHMRIFCRAKNDWCGNQYFKRCKGWWALTDAAPKCPARRTAENHRVKNRQIR